MLPPRKLTLIKGLVTEGLEGAGVVGEGCNIAPADGGGVDVKMLIAEGLQTRKQRVNLLLLIDEGGGGISAGADRAAVVDEHDDGISFYVLQ